MEIGWQNRRASPEEYPQNSTHCPFKKKGQKQKKDKNVLFLGTFDVK